MHDAWNRGTWTQPSTPLTGHSRLARLALCAGLLTTVGASSSALAQASGVGGGQPFDVNAVRPGLPGGGRVGTGLATSRREALPQEEGPLYRVSRFVIEYKNEHPQAPGVEDVLSAPVRLGVSDGAYVSASGGKGLTTLRLRDINDGNPAVFSAAALSSISRGIIEQLQRDGLASLIVQINDADINLATGEDLRPTKDGDLRVTVWTGVIADVRSVASGARLEKRIQRQELDRVNPDERVHNRIRAQSPVRPGELVQKQAIDDFAYRLNRHPGRRVDVAVGPGPQQGEVALDYIVSEAKPWSVYFQISNTGTEATSEWRERFGFVHNQLTGHDDILRVDYVTASFDQSNSFLASYDFPILSDKLRLKLSGAASDYDASDVGLAGERFTGENYSLGAELAWNFYQQKQLFVDLFGGVRWQSAETNNTLFDISGEEEFLIPYIGVRAERATDISQFFASVALEVQDESLSGVDNTQLQQLGRPAVDDSWQVLKFDLGTSFYLEPLFSDVYWGRGDPSAPRGGGGGRTTLAHEVQLGVRGQYAFNSRLIPTEQDVAGGFFSVRGYPESFSAGDTVVIATFEYRFHWPQSFAVSDTGHVGKRPMRLAKLLGADFRFAPQEPFGRTDWDLIFKGFVDVGTTEVSSAQAGEDSQTLLGAGVGVEFQYKRNLTARLDWGFALEDVTKPNDSVDSGDSRAHFLFTILY
jgi:hemolysin activation/secretion protein